MEFLLQKRNRPRALRHKDGKIRVTTLLRAALTGKRLGEYQHTPAL